MAKKYFFDVHRLVSNLSSEKSGMYGDWWYTATLIRAAKGLPVFNLPLKNIDLDTSPWQNNFTVFHFLQHADLMRRATLRHPIILAPGGCIINGWHRVAKSILLKRNTVKAVRLLDLPNPDGKY